MKILVTNHFVSAQNLGDLALVEAIISQMRETFDNPEIILESDNPELSRQYFKDVEIIERLFEIKNITLAKDIHSLEFIFKNFPQMVNLFFIFINYYLFKFVRVNVLQKRILEEYKNADLILMIGGDYLSKYYAYKLRFMEIELAKSLGKPIILYAHSVGPFSEKDIPYARRVLSLADGVYARDEKSELLLQEYGVKQDVVKRTADSVLIMKQEQSDEADAIIQSLHIDQNTVGVVIRDDGFSQMASDGYERYIQGMRSYIEYIQSKEYKVVLVAPNNSDVKATHAFKEKFSIDLPVFYTRDLHPIHAKYVLSHFRIVISPRMHPLIISSSAGVPVIGVGLEFKTRNYLQLVGLDQYCQKMDDFSLEDAKRAFDSINENYSQVRADLSESIKKIQEKSSLNLSYTKQIYESRVK